MKLRTKEGLAEPMPLSDIQRNNRLLNRLIYLGYVAFIYIVVMTTYIIYNNVVNNILAAISC